MRPRLAKLFRKLSIRLDPEPEVKATKNAAKLIEQRRLIRDLRDRVRQAEMVPARASRH